MRYDYGVKTAEWRSTKNWHKTEDGSLAFFFKDYEIDESKWFCILTDDEKSICLNPARKVGNEGVLTDEQRNKTLFEARNVKEDEIMKPQEDEDGLVEMAKANFPKRPPKKLTSPKIVIQAPTSKKSEYYGACFYVTASWFLFRNMGGAKFIRKVCCDYMEANKAYFIDWIALDTEEERTSFETYIENQRNESTFADYAPIIAFSNVFRLVVAGYDAKNKYWWFISPRSGSPIGTMFVNHTDEHYQLVLDVEEVKKHRHLIRIEE